MPGGSDTLFGRRVQADVRSRSTPGRTRSTVAERRRRRESPYADEHQRSVAAAWDASRRPPRDLRQAVRFVRAAWINETPDRLTEGPNSVGDDGNPRLAPETERFVFGRPDEVEHGDRDESIRYRLTPFRATLAEFDRGDEAQRHQAAIVRRVTSGEERPGAAAIIEGVPGWCAKDVAETALRRFLSSMSDVVVVEARAGSN